MSDRIRIHLTINEGRHPELYNFFSKISEPARVNQARALMEQVIKAQMVEYGATGSQQVVTPKIATPFPQNGNAGHSASQEEPRKPKVPIWPELDRELLGDDFGELS
jgi:hypothetical protein